METNGKIKEIRKDAGFSQEQMSDLMGISQSAYNRLEKGQRSIQLKEIPKIAKAMHKTEEEIMSQLSGFTVQNNIHQPQHNQSVVTITDPEILKQLLIAKDSIIESKQEIINSKDVVILAKDAVIRSKDETIEALRQRVGELENVK